MKTFIAIILATILVGCTLDDVALLNVANELNKSCPILVDRSTRLDKVTAMPGKRIFYHYTLVNHTWFELNTDSTAKNITPKLINHVRTNPDMASMREHNVTIVYRYSDKYGRFVWQLYVTPEMYK